MPTAEVADPSTAPYDFCTDPAYDGERASDPPLPPAALARLPPITKEPDSEYPPDPATGARAYKFVTQGGCACLPWDWNYYDPVRGVCVWC